MRSRRRPLPAGEFSAEILDLAQDGRGVARVGGKAVFVADALPGERVRLRYVHTGRDFDEAQVSVVERASPERVAPVCAHFGVCGGCALQHLAPEAQQRFKQKQLLDAFERIGKVRPQEVAAPLTGPTTGYRRRARLGVKFLAARDTALVGFRERQSGFLAALEGCSVLDPRVGPKLPALGALVAQLSIRRELPQIEVACASRVALVFRVLRAPSSEDCARLLAFGEAEDFDIYLQPGGPDSVAPLAPPAPVLEYSPAGDADRLRFGPTDFIQINGGISQQAVRQALSWLAPQPRERVLELFCGLGNFSVPLARREVRLTAVEGEAGLVARARENAQRLGLDIRFERADLFRPDAKADWLAGELDAVLLDPPRAGAQQILPLVAAAQPERILYVSCHPGTLARDAGLLVREYGYRLLRAGIMDMFPHTAHVESMALFVRAARRR